MYWRIYQAQKSAKNNIYSGSGSIYLVLSLCLSPFTIYSTANAETYSGSTSQACSGSAKLCVDCNTEYYYVYTYQYANIINGKISEENHDLNTSGFLGDANSYKIQEQATTRHVFYSNGKQILAIPFLDSNDGIWVTGMSFYKPGDMPRTWIKLCPN